MHNLSHSYSGVVTDIIFPITNPKTDRTSSLKLTVVANVSSQGQVLITKQKGRCARCQYYHHPPILMLSISLSHSTMLDASSVVVAIGTLMASSDYRCRLYCQFISNYLTILQHYYHRQITFMYMTEQSGNRHHSLDINSSPPKTGIPGRTHSVSIVIVVTIMHEHAPMLWLTCTIILR